MTKKQEEILKHLEKNEYYYVIGDDKRQFVAPDNLVKEGLLVKHEYNWGCAYQKK